MSDETLGRLRAISDQCVKSYESWLNDKKDGKSRESLQDAIHELRKVASRLEIEVAVSERQSQTQKQIPIPAHRSQNSNKGDGNTNILEDRGGHDPAQQKGNGGGLQVEKTKSRRRSQQKKNTGS